MLRAVDAAANVAAWQAWATARAAGDSGPGVLPARLEWTPVPGLGPGEEILGPLAGRTVLELGCGSGATTAYLASRGACAVGLDASHAQIERARARWQHIAGAGWIRAEANVFLARPGPLLDAVVSVFGALDFTDPAVLLRLAAARLRPGGRLAFSTIHPAQRARRRLDRLVLDGGVSVPVRRPLPDPDWWPAALAACGLDVDLQLPVTATDAPVPRCLVIAATKR